MKKNLMLSTPGTNMYADTVEISTSGLPDMPQHQVHSFTFASFT